MRLLLALIPLALLLAGCSQPTDDDQPATTTSTPSPPQADSYAIALSDLPVAPLEAGAQFRFNSTITGNATRASDHIGAHFGNQSSQAPSTAVYTVTCEHVAGDLPGRYQVTCTAPQEAGVYYLRGHARIMSGGAPVNWWSAEATFTVAPLQGNLQA